jgi:hypothetical protein
MRKWFWPAMALLFFIATPPVSAEYKVQKKAGDYTVDIRMDKDPPVAGSNEIEIVVQDKTGKAVKDAKVQVIASMPAMPGMPAMENRADAKIDGDKYKAKIELSMGGSWNMAVRITRGGKTATAKFTVDAR